MVIYIVLFYYLFIFIDICTEESCLNGVCFPLSSSTYTCDCFDGWSGDRCEICMSNTLPIFLFVSNLKGKNMIHVYLRIYIYIYIHVCNHLKLLRIFRCNEYMPLFKFACFALITKRIKKLAILVQNINVKKESCSESSLYNYVLMYYM